MTAKTKAPQVPQVGQSVQYFGSKGTPQAALVTMTAAEFDVEKAGHGMEAPAEGEVSLVVFGTSGRSFARHNVPQEGSEAHAALVAKAAETEIELEDGPTGDAPEDKPKPVTVRYWKPIA